ncbi:MAG TPA: hypothetical protein VHN79_03880 [Lacunisphaera sp.]|nr:hypothetical protein [Lacunisphaera sp.]
MRRFPLRVAVVLTCLPAVLASGADWTRIKDGVTPEQTTEALGKPLIRTYGRGFEVWIYDGRGEVVFGGGPALGWTVPVPSAESLARPAERDVLIKPVVRLPSMRRPSAQVAGSPELTETRFRYGRQR